MGTSFVNKTHETGTNFLNKTINGQEKQTLNGNTGTSFLNKTQEYGNQALKQNDHCKQRLEYRNQPLKQNNQLIGKENLQREH